MELGLQLNLCVNSYGYQYPAKFCEDYKGIRSYERYRHFCCKTVNIRGTGLSAAGVFEFIQEGLYSTSGRRGQRKQGVAWTA